MAQTLSADRQNIGGSVGLYLPRMDGERENWNYEIAEQKVVIEEYLILHFHMMMNHGTHF